MTDPLDRWDLRQLRDLCRQKEKAPAGEDQGANESTCGAEDSAGLTPEQLAYDARIARAHEAVIKHFEAGRRRAASIHYARMCDLIMARTADHVARLERLHGLSP
jgi:hypothetical protein